MAENNQIPQGFKAVEIPKGFRPVNVPMRSGEKTLQEQQLEQLGITREQAIASGQLQEDQPRRFEPMPDAGTPIEALGAGLRKGAFGVGTGALQLGSQIAEQFGADNQAFQEQLAQFAESERERFEAVTADAPISGASGELLGAIAAAPIPAVRGLAGAAGLGATMGAVQPTETTDPEQRIENAVVGSLFGLGSGAALRFMQKAPTVASEFLQDSQAIANSPTVQQLRAKTGRLYQQAEDSGIGFGQAKFRRFAKTLRDEITGAGARPRLTDKTITVLDEVDSLVGTNPSFKQLDELRRVAQMAASAIDPAERRLGSMIIDKIDNFVEKGNAAVGGTAREARNLWGRVRRDEAIAQIMAKAENNPSGIEQGLRVGFRQLLDNPKRLRGFTDAEKGVIRSITQGTPTQNLLRAIGKLGFDVGRATPNVIGGGGGAIVSGTLGGAPAIAAQQVVSIGAKRAAEALAKRKVNVLRSLTRSGKPESEITRIQNMLELAGNDDMLFNAIVRAAGIGAADER